MTWVAGMTRLMAITSIVALGGTGCAFQGLNSLPLPGAVGRGADAHVYHVEIANVSTLESNSPVLIDDVVVGSVAEMKFVDWHADVEISVKGDVVVPANAVASVGQTSLLGSMHLALDPPLGQPPMGGLPPGSTIPLNDSSTYPSTEQTLSSLSAVVNGGGLGQLGDIIHSANTVLNGRQDQVRDLLTRLDRFVGTLDDQRDNLVTSIQSLNRLSNTFATQRGVITEALQKIPPALDVLIKERPQITVALRKLHTLSDTATRLVDDSGADLVRNLQNLEPVVKALADVGPDIDTAIAYTAAFPYGQNLIDRGVRGDYMNLFAIFDLTVPRLKRTLLLGTRFGQLHAPLVPAPGEPFFYPHTDDPIGAPLAAAPPDAATPPEAGSPPPDAAPVIGEPVLPVTPPPSSGDGAPRPPDGDAPIFAGPYPSPPPAADQKAPPTSGGS